MRSASSLVALALLAVACGSAALAPSAPPSVSQAGTTRGVSFVEVASAQNSGYRDDDAAIIVGTTSAAAASVTALVPQASTTPGRVLIAAFAGEQRTGGYAIRIEKIERDGARLVVHAAFIEPAPGAIVTQAFTSPAHVVSIAQADGAGAREVVLLDGSGTERARATLP